MITDPEPNKARAFELKKSAIIRMLSLMFYIALIVMMFSALCLVGVASTHAQMRSSGFGRASTISIGSLLMIIAICVYVILPDKSETASVANLQSQDARSMAEEYPGRWQSDPRLDIVRTLIAQDIRGCGEFHWKSHYRDISDYLVYCTRDGKNWTAYIVWPDAMRVSGPSIPDGSIALPS